MVIYVFSGWFILNNIAYLKNFDSFFKEYTILVAFDRSEINDNSQIKKKLVCFTISGGQLCCIYVGILIILLKIRVYVGYRPNKTTRFILNVMKVR